MSTQHAHIVIAGSGMVGLSLALLLASKLPEDVQITLVEGMTLPTEGGPAPDYHPSFDARSTALSYSTACIYRRIGLWDRLQAGLAPIQSIHVSRRGRFGSSLLHAEEQGWKALGWVVENPCLGRALLSAVRAQGTAELRCPARVTDARPAGEKVAVTVTADGAAAVTLDADLLVIADGADSTLREQLGFLSRRQAYGQHALVTNLAFARSLGDCAFERFTASGPMALLPLPPSSAGEYRGALVWTLPPADAQRLQHAPDEEFAAALTDSFGDRLGRPVRIGSRYCYPLALTEAVEQTRRGMVVVGNAAHALHPVAGQGFNLALRDLDCLAETLAGAHSGGEGIGDTAVLQRYQLARERDQMQTIFASDGLPRLFALSDPVIALTRDLSLAGLDLIPAARRLFVQQAAGMAALEARGA